MLFILTISLAFSCVAAGEQFPRRLPDVYISFFNTGAANVAAARGAGPECLLTGGDCLRV